MEEITMSSMQLLSSYGALGVVAIYFMVKDYVLNKQLTEALQEFTIALNVMCRGKVD